MAKTKYKPLFGRDMKIADKLNMIKDYINMAKIAEMTGISKNLLSIRLKKSSEFKETEIRLLKEALKEIRRYVDEILEDNFNG